MPTSLVMSCTLPPPNAKRLRSTQARLSLLLSGFRVKRFVHICSLLLVLAGMLPTHVYGQSFDWSNIATDSPRPSARSGHGMVYDPVHARVVLFGGSDSTGTLNDVWEFDTATRHWTNVTPSSGPAPVPRSDFGMALDENRGVIVVYGGYCGAACVEYGNVGIVGDTWEWNTTTRTWRKGPSTIPIFVGLQGSALAYDPTRRQVICFAGRPYWSSGVNNTWAWNGTSWTDITPPGILPDIRFDHAMATDTDRNRIVMFGPFEDTWEWDGSQWTPVGQTGPHPTWRWGVKMAYDKGRHKTILFGGSNQYTAFNETWEWDGTTWTQLFPLHSPSGRGYTSLVYDESQNVLMMFSGGGQPDDTWISGPSDNIPPASEAASSPSANLSGWTNQNVTVILNTTDNSGGSGVQEITYSASGAQTIGSTTVNGANANLTITAEGETVITYFARDNAGNTEAAKTIDVKIDKTVPTINCGTADGAWHASDISINCTASDSVSSLADTSDASFALVTNVAAGTETASASTNNRQICDIAGNCATAESIVGNKVDKKPPTITITTPSAGTFYLLNQSVAASYSCTDGGSGMASCSGPVASGSNMDTASVGAKTFTVTASDSVGNTATPQAVNYTVAYGIRVLFDQSRTAKSGSTIPIKIQIVDANGNNVSSPAVVLHAVSVAQTSSNASVVLDDAGEANSDFDFRYDTSLGETGGYIFNLKTTGYSTGSYLLYFTVGGDPTSHSVQFQVRQ